MFHINDQGQTHTLSKKLTVLLQYLAEANEGYVHCCGSDNVIAFIFIIQLNV